MSRGDLATRLECPVFPRGTGGRGSRGDSGRRGDFILLPLWVLSTSWWWWSEGERGSAELSNTAAPLPRVPFTRGVCMAELMYISSEPAAAPLARVVE